MTSATMTAQDIAANVARVQERIAEACRRAGRSSDEVTLVGASKTVAPSVMRMAYEAGLRPGEVIVGANGEGVKSRGDLNLLLGGLGSWPRGQAQLTLEFVPEGGKEPEAITIYPRTVGLYPTQFY